MSRMVGRPVVAGVDGSESSRRAARWAAAAAARRKVALSLVHAVDVTPYTAAAGYVPPQGLFEALLDEGREWLLTAKAEIGAAYPALSVEVEAEIAHPARMLLARSERAGLVVLGASGSGGLAGVLAGSTALALAAHGRCPVAVVRGPEPGLAPPDDGPVVVGVDGSPDSEAAVAIGFEEASLRGARLIAVHAWNGFDPDEYSAVRRFVDDWASIETSEREVLAERLAGWRDKYPDVDVRRVVSRRRPAPCLLRHAAGAALLVVGSRGRGGFTGMLLGSTSRTLVQHAPCPVIVARPAAGR
ncbi:universal stress protein [Pseudonocardia acaciae]|uniref:universal stress protein n=1 Tax=Pseudonocardia acaciae TaxID=551276 RepID=UPI00048EB783|nr:universal stress protein [Pseudonocardia acaciae]